MAILHSGVAGETQRLQTFYPTSVLVTGFDIIFFWVARMIMFGLKFMDEVPFKEVYIHGLVRDADGAKMSKSKGNILDPLDLIDGIELEPLVRKRTSGLMQPRLAPKIEADTRRQYPDGIPAFGTDALRFTFCSLATQGRDIRFDLGRIEGYRNFCNKLWNAARYVIMNTEGHPLASTVPAEADLSVADKWIRSRLQTTTRTVHEGFASYRFDIAAQAIYEFIWNEYCDWYVELCKPVLLNEQTPEAQQAATRYTLIHVLEATLRLTHPVMPFVTEAIWQRVAQLAGITGESIMIRPLPEYDPALVDADAIAQTEWFKTFVLGIRSIRGEMDVPPSKRVPVLVAEASDLDRQRVEQHRSALQFLARVADIRILEAEETAPEAATSLLGEARLLIPLAGLIDKDAERARLNKELEKYGKDLVKCEAKLANPSFVERAPAAIVDKERARVDEMRAALHRFQEQLERLDRLA
jgi:valyl-tRNA synthetase